jgi:CheY-like chemotaxis protein
MAQKQIVSEHHVYRLTARGDGELKGAKTSLSPTALELLVRIDGRTPVAGLMSGMTLAPAEIVAALESLVALGYIESAAAVDDGTLDFVGGAFSSFAPSKSALDTAAREASAGITSLQQQGYFVRIARRPVSGPQLPTDRKPLVIIIEDEPQLAKFLKHYLGLEGFDARCAGNRDEIVEAFRAPPRPDLVLLDVMLPDADGFDVLARIKQHPVLASVPVIMLTAKTTREAVLKGLAGGADGYITKPFQTDVLVKAIKTMFGMSHGL